MDLSRDQNYSEIYMWPCYWPGLSNPGQVLSCLSFSEMGPFLAYGNRGFPKIPTSLIFFKIFFPIVEERDY